ncbi:MAG: Grx4 family monothiol glutaredoxin [SAR324 cluster bacterium]|nr:Grx4 family monothiol glutaredoxin [SAR324 cluster bacterium]
MAQIKELVSSSPVFLFMKGTPEMPQCGFSARVCKVLDSWNVPYKAFNVFSDENIRQGIKDYANWPTIPQLYINQEFVGGCDIVEEMSESGELIELFNAAYPDLKITPPPPPAQVKHVQPEEAVQILKDYPESQILDVRTYEEWEMVHLDNSIFLDQSKVGEILSSWDRNTPLIVLCHIGTQRSAQAAHFFTTEGFQQVYHVTGGIDAWAVSVDPTLPRY